MTTPQTDWCAECLGLEIADRARQPGIFVLQLAVGLCEHLSRVIVARILRLDGQSQQEVLCQQLDVDEVHLTFLIGRNLDDGNAVEVEGIPATGQNDTFKIGMRRIVIKTVGVKDQG